MSLNKLQKDNNYRELINLSKQRAFQDSIWWFLQLKVSGIHHLIRNTGVVLFVAQNRETDEWPESETLAPDEFYSLSSAPPPDYTFSIQSRDVYLWFPPAVDSSSTGLDLDPCLAQTNRSQTKTPTRQFAWIQGLIDITTLELFFFFSNDFFLRLWQSFFFATNFSASSSRYNCSPFKLTQARIWIDHFEFKSNSN